MNYNELNTKNKIKSKINCKFIEADIFLKMIEKGLSKDYIFPTYLEYFKKNEKSLNNKNIYFEKYFEKIEDKNKDEIKTMFEKFSDLCFDEINNIKVHKFEKLISKNIKINQYTEDLLRELATLIEEDFFETHIAKKSVAYDLEALHQSLNQNISILKEWTLEKQIDLIKNHNTTIVFSDNNSILFEVNDAETSLALGVKNWCISRDEYTFDDYRSNFERIYFHYDFNNNTPSTLKITAYVVDTEGNECEFQDKLNRRIQNYPLLDKIKTYFNPLTMDEKISKIETLSPEEQYFKILQEGFDEKEFSHLRDSVNVDNILSRDTYLISSVIKHNKHLLKEKVFFEAALQYIENKTDSLTHLDNVLFCKETRKNYLNSSSSISKYPLGYINYLNQDSDINILFNILKLKKITLIDQIKYELLETENTFSDYSKVIKLLNEEEKNEIFCSNFFNKLFENKDCNTLKNILSSIPKEYLNNIDKTYIEIFIKSNPDKFNFNFQKELCLLTGIFDPSKKDELLNLCIKEPRSCFTNNRIIKSLNISLNEEQTEQFLYRFFFETTKKEFNELTETERKLEGKYFGISNIIAKKVLESIPLSINTVNKFYKENEYVFLEPTSNNMNIALSEFLNNKNSSLKNKLKL